MKYWWLCVVWLSVAGAGQAQTKPAPTKTQDEAIRLTTDLVVVDTQVVSQANGKIIGGLQVGDFIVEEEGIKQEISFFSQDKLPLSVVLLFDLTDTVQPVLKELAQSAMQAVQHFKPEDELAVMVYSNRTYLLQDLTREREPIVKAIERAATLAAPEQLALFNEAIYQAAQHLPAHAQPRTRRVILWLTDNLPNKPPPSAHTETDAFAQLFEHDIAVFGLMLQSSEGKVLNFFNWFMKGAGDIFKYAERTGGEVIKVEKENVEQRMAEIIARVRARYTLGYISTNSSQDGRFRRIRVRVVPAVEKREGKVTLRGKAGYFAKVR
jgi:VWFA-related protein